MKKYITNTTIVIASLYVIFAGLSAAAVVLEWTTWDKVGDWLAKALALAGIVLAINIVVSLITQFLPHSDQVSKKK